MKFMKGVNMFIKARVTAAPANVVAFSKVIGGLACHSSGAGSALRAALLNQEDSEVRFKTHCLCLIDFWSRHWGEVHCLKFFEYSLFSLSIPSSLLMG